MASAAKVRFCARRRAALNNASIARGTAEQAETKVISEDRERVGTGF
jgi:hypothetical protein